MQYLDTRLLNQARTLATRRRYRTDFLGEIATDLRKLGVEATARKWFAESDRPNAALVRFARKHSLAFPVPSGSRHTYKGLQSFKERAPLGNRRYKKPQEIDLSLGRTVAQIAKANGVSTATIYRAMHKK